ncbi:MAG: hypothetical protein LW822_07000 [Phycisphaeraceae bacterium]|nr:hypothetical protein [Phycisphaeraceae bacterium]
MALSVVMTGSALGSAGPTPTGASNPPSAGVKRAPRWVPDPIDHLPEQVQEGILGWRARLQGAKVLKVTTKTDETWARVYELQPDGSPTQTRRERFNFHSWMTPDSVWTVAFGYKGEVPDTEKPIYQMYWSGKDRTVWERMWIEKKQAYRARKYSCEDPYGPEEPGFAEFTKGCIFISSLHSALAGGTDLADRSSGVQSIAFYRHPNLAMVPPDPRQAGVWLDVFSESVPRNESTEPGRFYRRQDFMLLARNEKGEPELREWRTLKLADGKEGGRKPTEVTGTRRFQFDFYDQAPPEVGATVRAFVADVEAGVAAQPAEEVPTAPEPPASPAQPAPR